MTVSTVSNPLYVGLTKTSVAEEKKFNPRLTKPKEEFIKIMDNLNLPYPKKIGELQKHVYLASFQSSFLGAVSKSSSRYKSYTHMITSQIAILWASFSLWLSVYS